MGIRLARPVAVLWTVAVLLSVVGCKESVSAPGVASGPSGNVQAGGGPAGQMTTGADGQSIVKKMCGYFSARESLSAHVQFKYEMKAAPPGAQLPSGDLVVVVAKPNQYHVRSNFAGGIYECFCNGETIVISQADGQGEGNNPPPPANYFETSAKPTLSASVSEPPAGAVIQNVGTFATGIVMSLLSDTAFEEIMAGVDAVNHLGVEKIGKVDCDHLQFVQKDFNWEIWIATGDKPLPQKIDFHFQQGNQNVSTLASIDRWKTDLNPPSNEFTFLPAKGANKVDSLAELLPGYREPEQPLVGKPAPAIEGQLLDGAPFALAEQTQKNVVMLDFWATWCGPCVMEIPVLMKVAEEYKEKGVVLFAVNQGETTEQIQSFLKRKKWDLNVVLDESSEIGNKFIGDGIPVLVIVGRDGVVKKMHVGYSPELEGALHKELDEVLAESNKQ